MSRLAPHDIVSDVPHGLLKGKTEDERWLYDQQSIQRQLLERMCFAIEQGDADRRSLSDSLDALSKRSAQEREELHKRIVPFEVLKEQWTGKKVLISAVVSVIAVPLFLVLVGAVVTAWMTGKFGK